MNAILLTIGSW